MFRYVQQGNVEVLIYTTGTHSGLLVLQLRIVAVEFWKPAEQLMRS